MSRDLRFLFQKHSWVSASAENQAGEAGPLEFLGWELVVSQVFIRHGHVSGSHAGRVRGRRGTSPNERHVLVSWVPSKEYGLVHVLGDRGIGDGLGGRLKAALAPKAAAVAAETVQLPPRGVMGRDASGLGVERVIVVNVIIVSVPVDEVFPGTRSCTGQGGESQGSQEGEEAKEEQALNAIIADASEGVQVVLVQPSAIQHGGQLVQAGLRVV